MNERFVLSFLWIGALKRKGRTSLNQWLKSEEPRDVFTGAVMYLDALVLARDETKVAV